MKNKSLLIGLLGIGLLGAAGYGLYMLGMNQGMGMAATPLAAATRPAGIPQTLAEGEAATRRHIESGLKAGDTDPQVSRKILYYQDPMMPGQRFDRPAKSPFMDMMLVPIYAQSESDADAGRVVVSPRIQQNLGIRTELVSEGSLVPQIEAVGSIAFNERDQVLLQARAAGFVESLAVRATLDRVRKGQVLAELYIPDWVAAQEEFLSLRRMQGTELAPLIDAARQRMRLAGMEAPLIARVESSGQVQTRVAVLAPMDGVVSELMVREGMSVMSGATLFRINGLGTVWAQAEVPESQSAMLRPGIRVRASSPGLPGASFEGRVQAILPEVNPSTRTMKARVELNNASGRLVPGMLVQMNFLDNRSAKSLLVPSEAVIQTGQRTVVMLAEENGRFRPAQVEIGIESGGQTEIKRGLKAGQRIVVSSQFLIDSEASLRGFEARLNVENKPAAATTHRGEARLEKVGKETVSLIHGPIASLKWPTMTMDFKPPPGGVPPDLRVGDSLSFEFLMTQDGPPQITKMTRIKAATGIPVPAKAKP